MGRFRRWLSLSLGHSPGLAVLIPSRDDAAARSRRLASRLRRLSPTCNASSRVAARISPAWRTARTFSVTRRCGSDRPNATVLLVPVCATTSKSGNVRAVRHAGLILASTRELALQVGDSLRCLDANLRLRAAASSLDGIRTAKPGPCPSDRESDRRNRPIAESSKRSQPSGCVDRCAPGLPCVQRRVSFTQGARMGTAYGKCRPIALPRGACEARRQSEGKQHARQAGRDQHQ